MKLIVVDDEMIKFFIEYMNTFETYIPIKKSEINNYNLNECEELIAIQKGIWLPDNIFLSKCKIFVANTEQLCDEKVQERIKSELLDVEHKCGYKIKVYDYSIENCKILNNMGYETIYHPYISGKNEIEYLRTLINSEKIYDIGFVGCLNERRKQIIDDLEKIGVKVKVIQSFGNERDIELAKCKYILNIHWTNHFNVFESIRCNRWLQAGYEIISEDSIDVITSTYLTLVSYNNLVIYIRNKILKQDLNKDKLVMSLVQTSNSNEHYNEYYSRINKEWNIEKDNEGWIGGCLKVSNLSQGYHKILQYYWDFYLTTLHPKVLLISESQIVKSEFNKIYPNWDIDIIDLYPDINLDNSTPTIVGDICSFNNPLHKKYDLIINQATLEHLYNPFQAMYNLSSSLNKNGLLVSHTHPPNFPYHRYPSDYIRFMKDWWYDLPKYINTIYLQELNMIENKYVFSCYIHY